MPREIWLIRGEGGAVTKMAPPFGEGIAERLRSGSLVRVNADGSLWTELPAAAPELPPADEPLTPETPPATLAEQRADKAIAEQAPNRIQLPMPERADRKSAWVAYVVSTGVITQDAAEDLTRAELIARYGG